jgi:signal transduction histidine kinase
VARHRRDVEDNAIRQPGAPVDGTPLAGYVATDPGRGGPGQTQPPPQPQRTSRRRTIRGRLARILALPLAAVVVLLAVVVTNDTNAYRTATATARAVGLTLEVQNLAQELQHERGLANNVLGGDVSFKAELPRARGLVDSELAKVAEMAAGAGNEAAATSAALRWLDDLAATRALVDAAQISRQAAFTYFTERIAALSGVDYGLDSSPDLTLRRGVSALEALGEAKEMTAQERAFLGGVIAAGGFATSEYRQFSVINSRQQAAIDRFNRFAEPLQRQRLYAALNTGAAHEAAFFEQRAMQAVDKPFVVSPQSWWSAHTTIIDDMRAAQESLGSDISARASQLQRDSTLRLSGLVALALLSAIGAAVVVVAAARSITRPLATLAAEARAVATQRLPEAVAWVQSAEQGQTLAPPVKVAVPPRSTAEIIAVADALDSAQATAYSLAAEQAILRRSTTESLANLGRRNQNLLRRQLGFITQLEREEIDPEGLANLFELDHLATRMRRNAESLLVLVGESSPRTWSEPLAVADVLRAAISEVEDYRRVTLRRIDDGFVSGAFVAGIAHMIAELVENGLAFSPPDTDVEIQGRALPGRYLIGITDQGIGMEEADLARANSRLRGEDSFLTAPTRYLGHFVVGHLARQMGIEVQVGRSPVTGVTARVTLGANVLATPRSVPAAAMPRQISPTPRQGNRAIASAPVVEYVTVAATSDGPRGAGRANGGDPNDGSVPTAGAKGVAGRGQPNGASHIGAPQPSLGQTGWGQDGASHNDVPGDYDLRDLDDPGNGASLRGVSARGDSARGDIASQVAHGGGERTRNGLLKRVPRQRSAQPAAAPNPAEAQPAASRSSADSPRPEASAEEARSRLTSLRAGFARGEGSQPDRDDNEGSFRAR